MRRSNRMKRIMREQWRPFLPSHARTKTVRFSGAPANSCIVQRHPDRQELVATVSQ